MQAISKFNVNLGDYVRVQPEYTEAFWLRVDGFTQAPDAQHQYGPGVEGECISVDNGLGFQPVHDTHYQVNLDEVVEVRRRAA